MSPVLTGAPREEHAARESAGASALPAAMPLLLLVVVVGQRIALPGPGAALQLSLVLGLACTGWLRLRGQVRDDLLRWQLYGVGALACVLVAPFAVAAGGPISMPSLLVLLALYLPWTQRVQAPVRAAYERLAGAYLTLMLVLAAVGAAQLISQLLGAWLYRDVMGELLPSSLLVQGYNTSIPLQFGSSVYKSNAFVFLEPSFLSQFCALAIIIGIVQGIRLWKLCVLAIGLVSAASGTGLVLLAFGAVLVLLRRPSALRPGVLLAPVVAAALALLTPVAALLLQRRDELGQGGSSGNSRFLAPYGQVAQGLASEPLRYLWGAGPGSVTRLLESSARGQLGDAVVYNIPTKLVFEYGLPAGALFTLFIAVALIRVRTEVAVPASLMLMLFVLSGSLLQPHTVLLAWLLTGAWAGLGTVDDDSQGATR